MHILKPQKLIYFLQSSVKKIYRNESITYYYRPDLPVRSDEYIKNITEGISDEPLKALLFSLQKKLNSSVDFSRMNIEWCFSRKVPVEYENLQILDEISAMSRSFNPQKDRALIDKISELLRSCRNCSDDTVQNKLLKEAEKFASIPVHSSGAALPLKGPVIDAYRATFEKYKILKILRFLINLRKQKFPDSLNENLRNQVLIDTVLNEKSVNQAIVDVLSKFKIKPEQALPVLEKHLWETYYLAKMPSEYQKILKRINEKYGIYIFAPKKASAAGLQNVMKELDAWNAVGGNSVKFPKVLDYCALDSRYSSLKSGGFTFKDSHIRIRGFKDTSKKLRILRHEMMHLNDKYWGYDNGKFNTRSYGHFGPNGCYDFTKDGEIIKNKKWHRDEFKKAGIPKKHIDYAYSNRAEYLAVAAEGDMKAYSAGFKKVLIELGMPEWVFNLQ